jgi:hypothetical protein
VAENPWSPPTVREDCEPPTPLWRLFFGWIATGLSVTFAVSSGVFLGLRQFSVIPTTILMSLALWRVGKNLRLNRPVP